MFKTLIQLHLVEENQFFLLTRELTKRVLESNFVPSLEWLSVAFEQVEDQLNGDHPASLGYALRPLLPLAARCVDSAALIRVCSLAERFWKDPELTINNRDGFALACYHDLDSGGWPDREVGERMLISLGIDRPSPGDFSILTSELVARVLDSEFVPLMDWLSSVLDRVEARLGGDNHASLGYALQPLLPLAARCDNPAALSQVCALVRGFWSNTGLTRSNRSGFAMACYRYLDEGAWPNRDEGERLLVSLGIEMPNPANLLLLQAELSERVMDLNFVPSADWFITVVDQVERQFAGDFPAPMGYVLQSLLPLAARCGDPEVQSRVSGFVERFWGREPGLNLGNRNGFAMACYRYLDEGAWPNREAAERLLSSLGIERPSLSSFLVLQNDLVERVINPSFFPSVDWLTSVLDRIEGQFGGESPAAIGYALRPLLPLVARCSDSTVLSRLQGLVQSFWKDPSLTQSNRLGFTLACYRYLAEGAWPDREAGERLLVSLGIERLKVAEGSANLEGALEVLLDLEGQAIALARDSTLLPTSDWLDAALTATAKPIEMGFPKAAGYLFPPLLAVAARIGSDSLWARLSAQIAALLVNSSFSRNGRKKFALACYAYLDTGAWPDREEGKNLLISLGIERPTE